MKSKWKDISILIVGFLSAGMGFLATLNIKFEWLTEASINSFGVFFVAAAMLITGAYAVWKNTYITKKSSKKKKGLK